MTAASRSDVRIVLLRAVNVGGTGRLAMRDLVAACEEAGYEDARTYIQSGNVVFRTREAEARIRSKLSKSLEAIVGKPVGVLVRTAAEMEGVLAASPFPDAEPSRVIVVFLDEPPPRSAIADVATPGGEQVAAKGREIYVHYPDGQGRSKLKLPFAKEGTGRNLNTVAKLVDIAAGIAG